MRVNLKMAFHFILVVIALTLSHSAAECYADNIVYTCIDKFGSNGAGCSLSTICCSTMGALVRDLNKQCDRFVKSQSSEVVIDIKSDLILNDTVNFGAICNNLVPIKIKGGSYVINCSFGIQKAENGKGQGFCFISLQNVSIIDLTFLNCGTFQNSTSRNVSQHGRDSTYLFPTALYFLNCSYVVLTNITISHSAGTGMAFFDTVGSVSITNCSFEDNRVREQLAYPGGGGLYIEFTKCTPGHLGNCQHGNYTAKKASYIINHCSFKHNNASLLSVQKTGYIKSDSSFQGMGKGGGVALYLNGHSINHSITIANCTFLNNTAVFGGGLFVQFRDSPANISLVNKTITS